MMATLLSTEKEQNYLSKYTASVLKILVNEHELERDFAEYLIENSSYMEFLESDPKFVMHYTPKYWANEIAEIASFLS